MLSRDWFRASRSARIGRAVACRAPTCRRAHDRNATPAAECCAEPRERDRAQRTRDGRDAGRLTPRGDAGRLTPGAMQVGLPPGAMQVAYLRGFRRRLSPRFAVCDPRLRPMPARPAPPRSVHRQRSPSRRPWLLTPKLGCDGFKPASHVAQCQCRTKTCRCTDCAGREVCR